MALFEEKDDGTNQEPEETVRPKIEPEVYRGITIDTAYTPASSLLTYVEGSDWTVDYYSQVLGADSEPMPLSLGRDPVYQQYKRIKSMVIRVTTPLGFNQDTETTTMEVTGAATTFPFLVPNIGDMFVADVGDGRIGLFTVSDQPVRATILRDSVYTIQYVMVSELTKSQMDDLEAKSIQTFTYSHDSLINGLGPFVTEQDRIREANYSDTYHELVSRYLQDFYSTEHATLLVPDQRDKTYDHFTTRAVLSLIGSRHHSRLRRVKELNVTAEPVMSEITAWDALLRQDATKLLGALTEMRLVSTRYFKGRVTLQALGYTGIDSVVFPKHAASSVDSWYDHEDAGDYGGESLLEGKPRRSTYMEFPSQAERQPPEFQETLVSAEVEPWAVPADIHPVAQDDYYIFTEAFYDDDAAQQSKLEMLARQVVNREALNLPQLDHLLTRVYDWDNLERFYYYPVLFVILKLAMRSRA